MSGVEPYPSLRPSCRAEEATRTESVRVVLPLESGVEQPLHIMPAPVVLSRAHKSATEAFWANCYIPSKISHVCYSLHDFYWFEPGAISEVVYFSGHGGWAERPRLEFVVFDTWVVFDVGRPPRPNRDETSVSRPGDATEEAPSATKDELSGLVAEIKTRAKNITERNLRMVKLIDEYRARWRAERRGVRECD
jgi:hypothetical protein